MRTLALALPLALPLPPGVATPVTRAQEGGTMEVFDEVDPYTGGEREKMRLLGYVAFGPFPWHGRDRTPDVEETMGGIPMLWVETAHFRIGSSLATYRIPADRAERARLKDELARLEERLGRLDAPRKELDPWLRLHLYAQRAEDAYAAFVRDFGLAPADFEQIGPHLGNREKFLLLLCERKSEFGRYARTYLGVENDHSYRWGWQEDCMLFGANVEALRDGWAETEVRVLPFDSMLHCAVVAGLAANFAGGYRGKLTAPQWFSAGLGHAYARRIDPRWLNSAGRRAGQRPDEDSEWEPRVRNLVKNRFFASTADMFGWQAYEDMDERDHLVAWSKLDYVLRGAEGDLPAFLAALCATTAPAEPGADRAVIASEQTAALRAGFQVTPAELDEAWAAWVLERYAKK